jgi:hypothetical protein
MSGFGSWLASAAATATLRRMIEENRAIDAAEAGVTVDYPCLEPRCQGRGAFRGLAPVSRNAVYECPRGHLTLVERRR